jgi:hypothetical protein
MEGNLLSNWGDNGQFLDNFHGYPLQIDNKSANNMFFTDDQHIVFTGTYHDPESWKIAATKYKMGDGTSALSPIPSSTAANFRIAPNPAKESIQVLFPEALTGQWTIIDMAGRTLLQGQAEGEPILSIQTGSLSAGLYCFVLRAQSGAVERAKLIISN